MRDIFDSNMLCHFKGPDRLHFSYGDGEGRYVFSLSLDFFNHLGNKQAGKKKSVGLISLVCLNLPPELRYKLEYMFLAGIIPGIHEPLLDKGNHYISPIINAFVELWSPGFGSVVRMVIRMEDWYAAQLLVLYVIYSLLRR